MEQLPNPSYETALKALVIENAQKDQEIARLQTLVAEYTDRIEATTRVVRAQSAQIRELEQVQYTDEMTGVRSRNYFESELVPELTAYIERSAALRRYSDIQQIQIGYVDVNKLKQINDTSGHAEGDKVIKAVASALQQSVRADSDSVVRLGGDEFLVVLRLPVDNERAVTRIKTFIETAAHQKIAELGATATFSIGFVKLDDYSSLEAALADSDSLMYQSKAKALDTPH